MTDPELQSALRAGADGLYALEAGTGMILAHGTWPAREDFQYFVHVADSITAPAPNWPASTGREQSPPSTAASSPAPAGRNACSGSQPASPATSPSNSATPSPGSITATSASWSRQSVTPPDDGSSRAGDELKTRLQAVCVPLVWPIACRAMDVLEITVDLGPGASPVLVETLVRGVRVVSDVGRAATLRRIRRAATEQMKFPTDDELALAAERLPDGSELSPRYRADNLRRARRNLAENAREVPPELFFDYWYRRGRRPGIPSGLLAAGYERALAGSPLPWPAGAAVGLDVVDPDLYQALVADQIARLAPTAITVREIRYRNPFAETMTAVGTGTQALTKGAGALETLATLGSRRKIKKTEARVAVRQPPMTGLRAPGLTSN